MKQDLGEHKPVLTGTPFLRFLWGKVKTFTFRVYTITLNIVFIGLGVEIVGSHSLSNQNTGICNVIFQVVVRLGNSNNAIQVF